MYKSACLRAPAFALLPMLALASVATGNAFELRNGGLTGGGNISSGGTFVLRSAIGRADASPVVVTGPLAFSSGPMKRRGSGVGSIFQDGFE